MCFVRFSRSPEESELNLKWGPLNCQSVMVGEIWSDCVQILAKQRWTKNPQIWRPCAARWTVTVTPNAKKKLNVINSNHHRLSFPPWISKKTSNWLQESLIMMFLASGKDAIFSLLFVVVYQWNSRNKFSANAKIGLLMYDWNQFLHRGWLKVWVADCFCDDTAQSSRLWEIGFSLIKAGPGGKFLGSLTATNNVVSFYHRKKGPSFALRPALPHEAT